MIILGSFFGFDDCFSRKLCIFAPMNPTEGLQYASDNEKKELSGIGTRPTMKR